MICPLYVHVTGMVTALKCLHACFLPSGASIWTLDICISFCDQMG